MENQLDDIYEDAWQNFHAHLEYELKTVESKFSTIHPFLNRNKSRLVIGLVSGLMQNDD